MTVCHKHTIHVHERHIFVSLCHVNPQSSNHFSPVHQITFKHSWKPFNRNVTGSGPQVSLIIRFSCHFSVSQADHGGVGVGRQTSKAGQSVAAKFGREGIRFPLWTHMILPQLLELCPPLILSHSLKDLIHSRSDFRHLDQRFVTQTLSALLLPQVIPLCLSLSGLNLHRSLWDLAWLYRLSTPPPYSTRRVGQTSCWPTMFLVLVVTPELREFLARARGGAVRLIKVRIQDGE